MFTFSNMNISDTSGSIAICFFLVFLGGGMASLGFRTDRVGTLVSIALDISQRIISGKMWLPL